MTMKENDREKKQRTEDNTESKEARSSEGLGRQEMDDNGKKKGRRENVAERKEEATKILSAATNRTRSKEQNTMSLLLSLRLSPLTSHTSM